MTKVNKLLIGKTDITHHRLIELAYLADAEYPFYKWVEIVAKNTANESGNLNSILLSITKENIYKLIIKCITASEENIPKLFDGKGEPYNHKKACFYFFSWIVRDAPQQRLSRLISEYRSTNKKLHSEEAIAETLSILIYEYRNLLKTFEWEAVREVMIDRLEGSRRAIRGSSKELIAKRGIAVAINSYYKKKGNYGAYSNYEVSNKQVKIGSHTYDVCLTLYENLTKNVYKVFIPVKTRETRGGGHAHLFTRDILEAARVLKQSQKNSYIIPVIIASDWSRDEEDTIRKEVDGLLIIRENPGEVENLSEVIQQELSNFIELVFEQKVLPKAVF